ncbi:putative cytochrome P450 94B3-like [Iris pallida]|uniref:Cytochrome P450 94B3-like n=1 Tax=Iris pallida TaxID=29817 RepID=A0AAX6H1V8_IRIPA|nr:putative cytochrome P450 94B3-like [Iris pallida]KAJ6834956.1 putative cytochrome P450 94B3-like [Iris pallida]
MEHRILIRTPRLEHPIRVQPPLWPELPAVLPPYALHPPHRVRAVHHNHALPHLRAVRQHVPLGAIPRLQRHGRVQPHRLRQRRVEVAHLPQLLQREHAARRAPVPRPHRLRLPDDPPPHFRPRRHQPEEPGHGRRRRVPPRQHVVEHEVAEELIGEVPFRHHHGE